MNFDFSQAITSYELLAITLALLALLMPLIKWLIVRIFFPLKLTYIPQTDNITLFLNESGPYTTLGFSLHCQNKPILIKNIKMLVARKSDKAQLSLIWSNIQSPTSQQMPDGGTIFINDIARPINLVANSLPFFIVDFTNTNNEVRNKFQKIHTEKMDGFNEINIDEILYEENLKKFKERPCYNQYYEEILEEMFWKQGDYDFDIITTYDNDKIIKSTYSFKISKQEYESFKKNIEVSLICRLNRKYNKVHNFYFVQTPFVKVK